MAGTKRVEYDGYKWLRVFYGPGEMETIWSYLPSWLSFPTDFDVHDPSDVYFEFAYADWDRYHTGWSGYCKAYGPYNGDDCMCSTLERVDSENPRICAYLRNMEMDVDPLDNKTKPFFDFMVDDAGNVINATKAGYSVPTPLIGYTRLGFCIIDDEYGSHNTNLKLRSGARDCYGMYEYHEDPYQAAAKAIKSCKAQSYSGYGVYNFDHTASTEPETEYGYGIANFILKTNIPVFMDYESAHNYIVNGVLDPDKCVNSNTELGGDKINKYYIKTQTYYYDNSRTLTGKDADTHKLDIEIQGKVHGYIQHNRDRYNIKLVCETGEDVTYLKYRGYVTVGGAYTTADVDTFLATEYADDWNTWKEFRPYQTNKYVKAGYFKTNIYIYGTRDEALEAFENPEIIPINYDDIEDSPENDTGDPCDTSEDLTSQEMTGSADGLFTLYRLNTAGLSALGDELYKYKDWSDKEDATAIYGDNPINALVSAYHCPISLTDFISHTYMNGIKYGTHAIEMPTGSTAKITHYGNLVTIGSAIISPVYNDFRDYTNFTFDLHLPFSNPITLDTSEIMNKQLVIKATVDPFKMQMRYYIIINGAVYKTVDTAIGREIPLVGNDAAGKAREMRQEYTELASSKASMVTGGLAIVGGAVAMATGVGALAGAGAIAGGLATMSNNINKNDNIASNIKQDGKLDPKRTFVGQFASGCGENDILYPYLVITEQRSIKPEALETTYGRPANLICKLSAVSGFTCAELTRVAVNATESEKAEISSILQAGIII